MNNLLACIDRVVDKVVDITVILFLIYMVIDYVWICKIKGEKMKEKWVNILIVTMLLSLTGMGIKIMTAKELRPVAIREISSLFAEHKHIPNGVPHAGETYVERKNPDGDINKCLVIYNHMQDEPSLRLVCLKNEVKK